MRDVPWLGLGAEGRRLMRAFAPWLTVAAVIAPLIITAGYCSPPTP